MTDILCPACGGTVAERVNATTVVIAHAGRTTTVVGGWVSTTCGHKSPPTYRSCKHEVVVAENERCSTC